MTDVVIPGLVLSTLFGLEVPARVVVGQAWYPFRPPVPIQAGTLDVLATARARLYKRYQGQPEWLRWVTAVSASSQQVIDYQDEIYWERFLKYAVGQQLDEIGASMDLARIGIGDDLYRRAIAVRGYTLIHDGNADDFLIAARAFKPESSLIAWTAGYPAGFCLEVADLLADEAPVLALLLGKMVPCGVAACILVSYPALAPGWSDLGGALGYESLWDSTTGPVPSAPSFWIAGGGLGG